MVPPFPFISSPNIVSVSATNTFGYVWLSKTEPPARIIPEECGSWKTNNKQSKPDGQRGLGKLSKPCTTRAATASQSTHPLTDHLIVPLASWDHPDLWNMDWSGHLKVCLLYVNSHYTNGKYPLPTCCLLSPDNTLSAQKHSWAMPQRFVSIRHTLRWSGWVVDLARLSPT